MTKSQTSVRRNKHFVLDQVRLSKAQKVLGTRTETETIEQALEFVISESEKERRAWAATESFLRSGIKIKDAFERLD